MTRPGPKAKANLFRDGFEDAAEKVSETLRRTRGLHLVWVPGNGDVCTKPVCKIPPDDIDMMVQAPEYVGIFNARTLVEHLEDDLIERQRAMSEQAAA